MKDVFVNLDGKSYRIVVAKMNGSTKIIGGYVKKKVYKGVIHNSNQSWCAIPERWTKVWTKIEGLMKDKGFL